jgi:hypothetical protein
MWLWYTHTEVQELKMRLYECYGKDGQVSKNLIEDNSFVAIIPKDELNDTL